MNIRQKALDYKLIYLTISAMIAIVGTLGRECILYIVLMKIYSVFIVGKGRMYIVDICYATL